MFLDYFALGLLFFVFITLFYAVIAIHDIPYEIAKRRNHPHQDAIHVAGWVSLFTLHVLWPFLWIWAMAYRPDRGWGFDGRPRPIVEKIIATLLAWRSAWPCSKAGRRGAALMELLMLLTYAAICYAIFKVFKIPVNKWTLPTAILGGIVLSSSSC